MKKNNIEEIQRNTKEAWRENWRKVRPEDIAEIFGYPRVKKLIEIYLEYLPKKGIILEAGCGLGQWVEYFRSKGYNIVGVDYNEPTISHAKSYNASLPLAVADVRALPFKSDSIDSYLSFGVIEHFIEGPDAAIKEAYRTLKKGGIAIVVVPHRSIFTVMKSPIVRIKRSYFLRKVFHKEKKAYYYQRYFMPKKLRAKFISVGYEVIFQRGIDHTFSLVEFSGLFRDKNTFDGENGLAVRLGNILEKIFPHMCAGSNLFVLKK